MYSRVCNNCGRRSYSSSANGEWECPYCGVNVDDKDLSLAK